MITICTYKLIPYLPLNKSRTELTTEIFREIINTLVRKNWGKFEEAGADPSLFFNHDIETGKTRIGYPLVIYHFINGHFFVTGINEGVLPVQLLARLYKKPFAIGGLMFPGFKKADFFESDLEILPDKMNQYRLEKWIPIHHKEYTGFTGLPLSEKANLLNQKLFKHIEAELGKYLNLKVENLNVEITNILTTYQKPEIYKGYKYYAFEIEFRANINLPRFLTLGNNKALGFGRVEPI